MWLRLTINHCHLLKLLSVSVSELHSFCILLIVKFYLLIVICYDSYLHFVKGVYEALELRDGGSDYLGKGVLKVFDTFFCFTLIYLEVLF